MNNDQLKTMQMEIDNMLTHQKQQTLTIDNDLDYQPVDKKARQDALQAEMQAMLGKKTGYGGDDLLTTDEKLGFSSDGKRFDGGVDTSVKGIPSQFNSIPTYTGG